MFSLRTLLLLGFLGFFILVLTPFSSLTSPTASVTYALDQVKLLDEYTMDSSSPVSRLNLTSLILNDSVNITSCSFSFYEGQTEVSGDSCVVEHTFYLGFYYLNVTFRAGNASLSGVVLLRVVDNEPERISVNLVKEPFDAPWVVVFSILVLIALLILFFFFRKQRDRLFGQLNRLEEQIASLERKK